MGFTSTISPFWSAPGDGERACKAGRGPRQEPLVLREPERAARAPRLSAEAPACAVVVLLVAGLEEVVAVRLRRLVGLLRLVAGAGEVAVEERRGEPVAVDGLDRR